MPLIGFERSRAIIDRGGRNAPCDECVIEREEGEREAKDVLPGEEYHHLLTKGRTQNADAARSAADSRYVCSWLCNHHHTGAGNVHNPAAARRLLAFNIRLYGYVKVERAYRAVVDSLHHPINIELPTEEEALGRHSPQNHLRAAGAV